MGKRVLVVDDEPSVLRLVSGGLLKQGYEVHAAPHPHQALELVKAASPCFDVVVSDVIMPDMCGPELVRNIKRVCPFIAVVLMSAQIASESLPEDAAFISKPFRMDELCSLVKKVISDSGDAQFP
jgi:two-component system, cell cycle sensor histidine kinase and response regulator CckA